MRNNHGQRRHIAALVAVWAMFCACASAVALEPGKVANVMILATGGTIAGTGASSTATVGYQSATVGVQRLIEAVPELKKVASVKG